MTSSRLWIPRDSLTVQNKSFLRKLSKAANDQKKVQDLLKKATPNQIRALSEVALNILQNNLPNTGKQFVNNLLPFKSILRQLSQRKSSPTKKRDQLLRQNNQKGGLPFLIPLLAPLLGTLVSAGIQAAI